MSGIDYNFLDGGEYQISDSLVFLPSGMTTNDIFRVYNNSGRLQTFDGGSGLTINGVSGDRFTVRAPEWVQIKVVSGGFEIDRLSPAFVESFKSPDGTLSAAKAMANVEFYNPDEVVLLHGMSTSSENGLYVRGVSGSTKIWTKIAGV